MKQKFFFKVLTNVGSDDYYYSARCGGVEYKQNEITVAPKGTKLFVFDSFDTANRFAILGETIAQVEVINPTKAKVCSAMVSLIPEFWKVYRAKKGKKSLLYPDGSLRWNFQYVPKGTYFADAVKIVSFCKRT